DPGSLPRKRKKRKKQPIAQVSDVALTGPAANPVPGRSLAGRRIIQVGPNYEVRDGSIVILCTQSRAVAEATIEAIDTPIKPWSDEYLRVLSYQRAWQAEMEANAKALMDMLLTGRV